MSDGWRITDGNVIPIGDLKEHWEDTGCWCRPTWDGNVLVHHAADMREQHEAN